MFRAACSTTQPCIQSDAPANVYGMECLSIWRYSFTSWDREDAVVYSLSDVSTLGTPANNQLYRQEVAIRLTLHHSLGSASYV